MLFLLLSEFVCLQKNIPDRRKTVRDVSKRVTTLLSPPVACTALSPPLTRGCACNCAPPSRPVQAECSGASTTKRPHRLTPAAGSLSAGLPRLFPILAYCDITAYFISFFSIFKNLQPFTNHHQGVSKQILPFPFVNFQPILIVH